MIINGIQYMRPNGRINPFTTEIPDDLQEKWKQIQDCGLRLAGELLLTDDVSTTLENDEGDFDIEIVRNEPGAPVKAVVDLVARFDLNAFREWKNNLK